MSFVIARLLQALRCNGAKLGVGGALQSLPEPALERAEQKIAYDGVSEVDVGQLDQSDVAILVFASEECQLILIAALTLDCPRMGEEQARLPDEIERDVGEREILFQHRRVPAPF